MKQIYNRFAHSPLAVSQWLSFQEEMNLKPFKMLSYGQTRWRRIQEAVNRILNR